MGAFTERLGVAHMPVNPHSEDRHVNDEGDTKREKFQGDGTRYTLLERVAEGDSSSMAELAAVYGPLIKNWCQRHRLSEHDAEDVMQDVVVKLIAHVLPNRVYVKREDVRFRAYLSKIVRNRCMELYRHRSRDAAGGTQHLQRLAEISDQRVEELSSTLVARLERDDALRVEAIERVKLRVSEQARIIWEQFVEQGRSGRDVANELGIKRGTLYQARHRFNQQVREELRQLRARCFGVETMEVIDEKRPIQE